jgi:LacI family transcriptional regulator
MASTLREVAARAGVSAITVSRALRNTGLVSGATRARVLAAIAELDYVPNGAARSLRSNKTQLLALLLPDITNPFWTTVARGVEDAALQAEYGVILCNTDEEPAKEARYLDLLLRQRIDGLLVAPTSESTQILQDLERRAVPFVLIDRAVAGVAADIVRGDSRGGAQRMAEHLLAGGYRRIAVLTGPLTVSTAEERVAGYLAALAAAGVPADPDLIFYGRYREEWGFEITRDLMGRSSRPDAIFAANNFIAMGVLEALTTLGLQAPDDVALVCFDDTTQLTAARFLTTTVQPAREMGRVGVDLLLARLAAPGRPLQEVLLPTELVVRSSCGCAAPATRPA